MDYKVLRAAGHALWHPLITPDNIAQAVTQQMLDEAPEAEEDEEEDLTAKDMIVDWNFLHMGMKDKDPMTKVKFYAKSRPNRKSSWPPHANTGATDSCG